VRLEVRARDHAALPGPVAIEGEQDIDAVVPVRDRRKHPAGAVPLGLWGGDRLPKRKILNRHDSNRGRETAAQ
jgi:hypothetical protein